MIARSVLSLVLLPQVCSPTGLVDAGVLSCPLRSLSTWELLFRRPRLNRRCSLLDEPSLDSASVLSPCRVSLSSVKLAITFANQFTVPMYQAESLPKWIRGFVIGSYQLAITIGLLLASLVNYGTENRDDSGSYRIPLAIQFAWSIILCVGKSQEQRLTMRNEGANSPSQACSSCLKHLDFSSRSARSSKPSNHCSSYVVYRPTTQVLSASSKRSRVTGSTRNRSARLPTSNASKETWVSVPSPVLFFRVSSSLSE